MRRMVRQTIAVRREKIHALATQSKWEKNAKQTLYRRGPRRMEPLRTRIDATYVGTNVVQNGAVGVLEARDGGEAEGTAIEHAGEGCAREDAGCH